MTGKATDQPFWKVTFGKEERKGLSTAGVRVRQLAGST